MPNRATHVAAGTIAGGVAAALKAPACSESELIAEVIGGLAGGWVGGILPDVLEPATSPNHRQLAHSLVVGGSLAVAKVAEMQASCRSWSSEATQRASLLPVGSPERRDAELVALLWRFVAGFLIGLATGYASHLALDACTPRGLPLLGRFSE